MPQDPAVYPDLTVRENLRYFARVLRVPPDRVEQEIDTVGLGDRAHQAARTLSGGECARVSLAAALLAEPQVLVLDEPTVGLDPVLRRDLWRTFHRLAGAGATVLVSSHVMDEAERCDQLLLMRQGKLIAVGAPKVIREDTGADSLEGAFLRLVEGARAA
jgi:ABC-2 type transport system ATP-binding protein